LGLLLLTSSQFLIPTCALAQAVSTKDELFLRRRENVLEFVHENHPKMEALLLSLEESKPAKFRSAIKRIGKTLLKMRSLKEKQPERYAASVELWKAKSEIEMLTARLANRDTPEMRKRLDVLVEVFIDNRRQLLEIEKKHILQRLERTNRLLEMIETDRDAFVKKNLRSVDRTIKQLSADKSNTK
jgi:ribosomal protein S24E